MRARRTATRGSLALLVACALAAPASAQATTQPTPFAQNWANTGLITSDDNWAGVPGIVGFRGDGLVAMTAVDPRTVLADGGATPIDVNANQSNPNTYTSGGLAEFELTNPTVALQGSGVASAPHLVIPLDTSERQGVAVGYRLRDIDGSTDNSVQAVDLQYRVGGAGSWTSVGGGFVADATTGPSLASLETAVAVTLPPAADDKPLVELRVLTTNAVGNDEWVGVDDISVSSAPLQKSVGETPSGGGQIPGSPVAVVGTGTKGPAAPTPLKCRKGFKKKQVKGKPKCVKKRKKQRKRGH
jgi:hypothetical protein